VNSLIVSNKQQTMAGNSLTSDAWPFTTTVAVRLEQKASIQFTKSDGMPLAASRYSSLSLWPPLDAPFTSKLTKLTILLPLHAV
jgi:hypothetical protein